MYGRALKLGGSGRKRTSTRPSASVAAPCSPLERDFQYVSRRYVASFWTKQAVVVISAKTHFHAVDFNIFEGQEVTGVAHTTISRGDVVFENNQLHVECGHGKFVEREAFGYNFVKVEARDKAREIAEKPVDRKPYAGKVWTPADK